MYIAATYRRPRKVPMRRAPTVLSRAGTSGSEEPLMGAVALGDDIAKIKLDVGELRPPT